MTDCCAYCERSFCEIIPAQNRVVITKDHIIPISRGGVNRHFNRAKVCFYCNSCKADKLPSEFLKIIDKHIRRGRRLGRIPDSRLHILKSNIEKLIPLEGDIRFYTNKYFFDSIKDSIRA